MKKILVTSTVALAVTLSLYQIWQPLAGFFAPGVIPFEEVLGLQPATYFRPVHLAWVLCLGFLVYPLNSARFIDYLAIPLVLAATVRVLQFDYQGLDHLLYGLDGFDFASGIIIVAATLEIARRAVGPVMLVVGLVFILYGAFGNLLPDGSFSRL
jgi:TRAP-type uncharacterized transport system fused permease subunit